MLWEILLCSKKLPFDVLNNEIEKIYPRVSFDDFIRSNEIIRTKWPIHVVIGHFVLMI